MGNIYGVDQELPLDAQFTAGSDVTMTAGTETTGLTTTTAFKATTPGDYYAVVDGAMVLVMGGTASASFIIGVRVHSGSDLATYTVNTGFLVNSATFAVPFKFILTESASLWYPGGAIIEVTGLAGTTNCTMAHIGSYMNIGVRRGLNSTP
jgi:hypothetical protein